VGVVDREIERCCSGQSRSERPPRLAYSDAAVELVPTPA